MFRRVLLRALEHADAHGNRPALLVVQRGLALTLPLVMVGALALMFRNAPVEVRQLLDAAFGLHWVVLCDTLVAGTFGIASLALLCAFSGTMTMLANQRRAGPFVSPITAMVVCLCCFFVLTPPPADLTAWKSLLAMDRGLLLALAVSVSSNALFLRLSRIPAFQLPLATVGHDPVVRDMLTVLPASMATIAVFGLLRLALVALNATELTSATRDLLYLPFAHAQDGLSFGLVYTALCQLLWMVGAHGPNLLSGVESNILMPAGLANAATAGQGLDPVFLFTKAFFNAFTRLGGSGSTLCLIIAMFLASRDSGGRKLCRFALLPALCNVNEPLLFGIPLVFNPVYCIPFLLTPLLQVLAAYVAASLHLLPHTVASPSWTMPIFLSGYQATGSLAGPLMQAVNLALGVAVYTPFVRLADELRERQGKRVLDGLLDAAMRCHAGPGGRKCLDLPGEPGRLAKALANDLAAVLNNRNNGNGGNSEHRGKSVGGENAARGKDGARSQLHLAYQPQLNSNGNTVIGVEALLRWQHPAYGCIAPNVAVALAEDAGLMDQLGLWVLAQACSQRAAWAGQVPDTLRMSVNVSPRQLAAPAFPNWVLRTLESTGLSPQLLELEITESSVLEPDARIVDALKFLQHHGVRVAIDDFGMGHASLRYLRAFPVDTVKIDRSLTLDHAGSVNEHIVRSILELSQAMGFATVVEGVEHQSQLDRFLALGCKAFQGYLFSRPLQGEACLAYVQARQHGA